MSRRKRWGIVIGAVLAAVAAYVLWLGRFRSEVGSAASIQDVPWIGGQLKPLKTMGEVHYYYLFQPREERQLRE